MELYTTEYFMNEALKEAQKAFDMNEVPIGAVVVSGKQIIARACNQTQQLNDVTAHAEMIAITSAANYLGNKYLEQCTLYVTLEPCPMCASALYWAHVGKIVYGTADEKRGYMTFGNELLHPKTKVEYGVLEHRCSDLIKRFFERRRKQANYK